MRNPRHLFVFLTISVLLLAAVYGLATRPFLSSPIPHDRP